MNKLFLIFNPVSGKKSANTHLADIIDIFCKNDYEVTIYASQKRNDIKNQLINLEDIYNLAVVIGGDGSLNEAVSAYMENSNLPPLGYIPAGSTNDFAKSLKLSTSQKECAKAIASGNDFNCDIGYFNNNYFTYVAAFGSISEVSYSTPQASKNILGHNAYVVEGLKQVLNMKKYRMKIAYDDQIIEDEFCYGMISNSSSIGGFKFYKENTYSLDDGEFECMFIKYPNNPLDLSQVYYALQHHEYKESLRIYHFKTSKLTISSPKDVKWTLDGEFAGKHKDVEITCLNKVITFRK